MKISLSCKFIAIYGELILLNVKLVFIEEYILTQ